MAGAGTVFAAGGVAGTSVVVDVAGGAAGVAVVGAAGVTVVDAAGALAAGALAAGAISVLVIVDVTEVEGVAVLYR
ncbi:MAG: hypothetical protein M3O03_09025 [Pseudomonadota bacterium]|nr:hypothetical protein [Pseudomonadota bacterium]